ncbi:MAG: hypothetical protein EA420_03020 [Candidatus Competibacteraceae bacterium]|nr:MAG: hypothetical protein EA420_03020 [Candidatus Competibacteraceae bacterium]
MSLKTHRILQSPPAALAALALLLASGPAFAQSFALDTILPASLIGQPFLIQVITLIVMIIIAGAFITLGFGVMGGIADVFTTLTDARRMGEWGLFMKTLGMVFGVVVVGVVLAALIYTWLSTVNIAPTVTIGGG